MEPIDDEISWLNIDPKPFKRAEVCHDTGCMIVPGIKAWLQLPQLAMVPLGLATMTPG